MKNTDCPTLELFDTMIIFTKITGKEHAVTKRGNVGISTADLAEGMYFLQIIFENRLVESHKFVIVRK